MISILLAALAAASSAEAATEAATARVHAVDAQIHAVISLDPTALDQARAIDRGRRARGLLYGYAILLKDNIEADGPLPTTAGSMALKPTVGLVSRARIVPISHSQDTAGPIAADVATAARVLSAIAGADSADPATKDADAHIADYLAALKPDALKGARIGVLRFATGWSAATDKVFEQALTVLKAQGATLVDITALKDRDKMGEAETLVLHTELKADLNSYLATTPPAVKTRTLADVIAFDAAHADRELGLFGQETFVKAEATKGLDDPAYQAARATSLRIAGRDGIDAMLAAGRLDALVSPTMPPAWKIDAANGDQISGAGAGSLAAVAGYPHLTVPMGAVMGLPVGLSIIGPAWSEARLLGYGYAYEQSAKAKVTPRFLPSIEGVAPVAPLLEPLQRRR
ncbi:MAG: amidase family protein [Acidobacteriaceae bacterium]